MKYKVNFSGFAYVETDDDDEESDVKDLFFEEDYAYRTIHIDNIEEVEEFRLSTSNFKD